MTTFVRKLWNILSDFHSKIYRFWLWILVYEGLALIESGVMGFLVWSTSQGWGTAAVSATIAGLLVYDVLFVLLDNKLDFMIMFDLLYPVYRSIKERALRVFAYMDAKWHQDQNSGVLIGKIQSGTEKVSNIVENLAWEFVPTVFQSVLTLILLAVISPVASAICVLSLLVFMGITQRQHKALLPIREIRQKLNEEEWGAGQQMVQSHETVTLTVNEKRLLEKYSRTHGEIIEAARKEAVIGFLKYGRPKMLIVSISKRAIQFFLFLAVVNGALPIFKLLIAWELIGKLYSSFWRFSRIYERVMQGQVAVERLSDLVIQTPSIVDPTNPLEIPRPPVGIVFRKVRFSYHNGSEALKGVSFRVAPGETVGIVGQSGAGKTTLRRVLTRLWEVVDGEIEIGGVNIGSLRLADLRSLVAYVPQGDDVYVYDDTVGANIAFGRPDATQTEIEWASGLAGIHDFIMLQPTGYSTLLGERGIKLSGGQKQRVALARALLMDRPILVLDEATNALDSITEKEIQDKINPYLKDKGRTVLIIAHRLSTLRGVVDRIIVMDSGKVVEEGTHEELLDIDGGMYQRLWETQMRDLSRTE